MTHLLLVDDDKHFRRSLSIGLEEAGYGILEAESALDAVEMLDSSNESDVGIGAVVVDAKMPGLDGFWLTDQIAVKRPDIPAVILSAYAYPETPERRILTKPVDIDRLIDVLNTTAEESVA